MRIGLIGLLLALSSPVWGTPHEIERSSPVSIHPDGSLSGVFVMEDRLVSPDLVGTRRRLVFGMPDKKPKRRWREKESLPIYHTAWEEGGIRYTQMVLMTALSGSDPNQLDLPPNEVLMVRIVGECLASEYTEARAAFGMESGGRTFHLTLRDDLVFSTSRSNSPPLALIDLPSGGVATLSGTRLHFHASMPPSDSGGMTVKIPLGRLRGEEEIKQLRSLDFKDEWAHLKRVYSRRVKEGLPLSLPLQFAPE